MKDEKKNQVHRSKQSVSQRAVKNTASKGRTSTVTRIQHNPTKPKKTSKKWRNVLGVCLCAVCLIFILSSSLFQVQDIVVEGNQHISSEEVISLSGIEKYANIFQMNKWEAIQQLKTNPYVEDAKIVRKLPHTVCIQVQERIPNYMLQFADSYVYINNQGYMLEISNEKLEVPILIGITTDLSNIQTGNRMAVDDLKKMDKVIQIYETAKRNEMATYISKIDISNERNYTLILETEGKTVYLGDCSNLNMKMIYLKDILEREKGTSGELFLNVDLNEQKVYFRETT